MAPLPPPKPPLGWWTELSRDRWIAGVAADIRERRELAEREKRLRRLRRRVERVNEMIVLAESASEARRHLRATYGTDADRYWHGTPRGRSAEARQTGPVPDHGPNAGLAGELNYHPGGRILSVRR